MLSTPWGKTSSVALRIYGKVGLRLWDLPMRFTHRYWQVCLASSPHSSYPPWAQHRAASTNSKTIALQAVSCPREEALASPYFHYTGSEYQELKREICHVLREGLEAITYIGGGSLDMPATSFPLAIVCGLIARCVVGYVMCQYISQHIYSNDNTDLIKVVARNSPYGYYL